MKKSELTSVVNLLKLLVGSSDAGDRADLRVFGDGTGQLIRSSWKGHEIADYSFTSIDQLVYILEDLGFEVTDE